MSEESNNEPIETADKAAEPIVGKIRVRRHAEDYPRLGFKKGERVLDSPTIEVSNAGVTRIYVTANEPFEVTETERRHAIQTGYFEDVPAENQLPGNDDGQEGGSGQSNEGQADDHHDDTHGEQ